MALTRGWRNHLGRTVAGVAVMGLVCSACSSTPTAAKRPLATEVTTSTTTSTTTAVPVAQCTSDLSASVAFNATGTELGDLRLTNRSAAPCSLFGQPKVTAISTDGTALDMTEVVLHRAPDWPPPTSPIVLSASGALPQAIVSLDWTWCGTVPSIGQFDVLFSGWSAPLVIPDSAISPPNVVPASCDISGNHTLWAVDYVRGFGREGIIGPSS